MSVTPTKFETKCNIINEKLDELRVQRQDLKSKKNELDEKLTEIKENREELSNTFADLSNQTEEFINSILNFLKELEEDSQGYEPLNRFVKDAKKCVEKINLSSIKDDQEPPKEYIDTAIKLFSFMKLLEEKIQNAETFLSEKVRVKRRL